MKVLLILLLLIPIITKKDQVLSAAVKRNTDIQEGLSLTNADVKNKEIHQLLRILLQGWNDPNGELQPPIGNAIFLDNSLTLPKNFQDDVQNDFHAKIMKVDFRHPKEAEKEINEYVKKKTEGKIEDVVKDLSEDTKMVLMINYVLFKVVELPYKDDVSMIIVIAELDKIHEVERGMSAETIQQWRTSLTERTLQFHFLELSVEVTMDPEEQPLENLGTKTTSTDTADFSRISNDVNLNEGKEPQKAQINEDEKAPDVAARTVLQSSSKAVIIFMVSENVKSSVFFPVELYLIFDKPESA